VGRLRLRSRHRVLCGDSTKAEDVERVTGGEKAAVVFTDPPYGIDYSDVQGRFEKIANDAEDPTDLVARAIVLQPAAAVYLCCNWRCLDAMVRAMKASGLEPKATIVWDKGSRIQNLDRYAKRHELIVYAGPYGGQVTLDDDVWEIARETRDDHPTAKPVSDGQAGRALRPSDPARERSRGDCLRSLPRIWLDADRRRATRSSMLRHGDRPDLLRRHRQAMGEPHRRGGGSC